MFSSDEDIITVIIISSALIFIFAIVVVIAIAQYRAKQRQLAERENTISQELTKAILEAKEETLKTFAERIHGDIQQSLSLIKLNLNKVLIQKDDLDLDRIEQSKELVANTIAEVKDLSKEMDPKYISGHTLEENIERQLERVRKQTDLKTIFHTSDIEVVLDDKSQIFLHRIIQEAINNILSHAEASNVTIAIVHLGSHFQLSIQDDGKGFHHSSPIEEGIGIISMRNRTELMNGTFLMKSDEKEGTLIELKIPLK
ncbi:ATP-binding protein [Aureisphaera galaxeae]|uniref:sensor histidine kinase n=1 Tax=Aureisphaera galaxeae TaxID=1538023 RepID=UPI002350A9C8|nr:ATP-binding protein [Aureisphaera galaxeae]MDC8006038.1 ATP-binding protein [Aureisphaera galaxeae]